METDFAPDDEISVLDIAVVLAESWKLILGSTLLAGALAYGAANLVSARYQSEAIVRLSPDEVALLLSPRVIDPVIRNAASFSEFGSSVTSARRAILQAMSAEQLNGGDMYQITLSGRDPVAVQTLLGDLLEQLSKESVPVGDRAELLKQDLMAQQEALATLRAALSRLGGSLERAETTDTGTSLPLVGAGESIVALASATEAKRRDIQNTTRALEGSVGDSDILQEPTMPDEPLEQNKLFIAAAIAALMGILATVYAFFREGWRRSQNNPAADEKVARIRRALKWSLKPD
jgi:Chain length determinant protein.